MARVARSYDSWRGRAIEPVVRSALSRLLPDDDWPGVTAVGGWWPRTNSPEIDLVGVDRTPADRVGFVGAIKWRPTGSVTSTEISALASNALHVPGASVETPLVTVTGTRKTRDSRVRHSWTAADLLAAW